MDKKPVDANVVNKMLHSLRYRGPDRQNIYMDDEIGIGLGHALFKTTFEDEYDRQPYSLNGDVWIVSSARIDDRKNLINKLLVPWAYFRPILEASPKLFMNGKTSSVSRPFMRDAVNNDYFRLLVFACGNRFDIPFRGIRSCQG